MTSQECRDHITHIKYVVITRFEMSMSQYVSVYLTAKKLKKITDYKYKAKQSKARQNKAKGVSTKVQAVAYMPGVSSL